MKKETIEMLHKATIDGVDLKEPFIVVGKNIVCLDLTDLRELLDICLSVEYAQEPEYEEKAKQILRTD